MLNLGERGANERVGIFHVLRTLALLQVQEVFKTLSDLLAGSDQQTG